MTPYEAVYGYPPPTIPRYENGSAVDDTVDCELRTREEALESLKLNIQKAQNRMRQTYNKGRKDREFQVGDYVWLKRLPLHQRSLMGQPYSKLLPRYYGPYPVLQKVGKAAYRLGLPRAAVVHPVFHVTRLKPHYGEVPSIIEHIPDELPTPYRILKHRHVQRQGQKRHEVLVEWEGPDRGTSWEEYDQIAHRFPAGRAWGQARFKEGGSVTGLPTDPSRAAAVEAEDDAVVLGRIDSGSPERAEDSTASDQANRGGVGGQAQIECRQAEIYPQGAQEIGPTPGVDQSTQSPV
jgi:hypothetical protein